MDHAEPGAMWGRTDGGLMALSAALTPALPSQENVAEGVALLKFFTVCKHVVSFNSLALPKITT